MEKVLIILGLSKNQSIVYNKLLSLVESSAGEIIKNSGLHRAIVYDCLEKLVKKGLINYIIIKNIRKYRVANPLELEKEVERQKQELKEKETFIKDIKKKIEKNKKEKIDNADAKIYSGKRGVKLVFEEIINNKGNILIFATGGGMKKVMKNYFYNWHLKLKKNKIKGKALVGNKIKLEEKYPYQIKYLPEKHVLPSTIIVQGDKIINIIWQEEPLAIVIKSLEASKSYKEYFNILWKIASNNPQKS